MNQSDKVLGNVVRETRKNKKISQELLAEKVGVCKKTIIEIEKNTGNPTFEVLFALVQELDLPVYTLFFPNATENLKISHNIMQKLCNCSIQEMRLILAVVESMVHFLGNQEEAPREINSIHMK